MSDMDDLVVEAALQDHAEKMRECPHQAGVTFKGCPLCKIDELKLHIAKLETEVSELTQENTDWEREARQWKKRGDMAIANYERHTRHVTTVGSAGDHPHAAFQTSDDDALKQQLSAYEEDALGIQMLRERAEKAEAENSVLRLERHEWLTRHAGWHADTEER